MMAKDRTISDNQLAALSFVLMLSPALRLFPSAAAGSAGRSAPLPRGGGRERACAR